MINLGASAFGVAMQPNGRFIYFAAGNEVLAYSVTSTGTLKAIQGSPFLTPGATSLSAISVSPSGKFLSPLSPATFATGKAPGSTVVTETLR